MDRIQVNEQLRWKERWNSVLEGLHQWLDEKSVVLISAKLKLHEVSELRYIYFFQLSAYKKGGRYLVTVEKYEEVMDINCKQTFWQDVKGIQKFSQSKD